MDVSAREHPGKTKGLRVRNQKRKPILLLTPDP
jgi:hypothetical protein